MATQENGSFDSGLHELIVPINVLSDRNFSVLESIVIYLKDRLGFRFKKVAELLNRDQRTIWTVYHRSRNKKVGDRKLFSGETVPVSVLAKRESSIFESIVGYLKEKRGLKNSEIADITSRNPRTIWTVYSRYKKKVGDSNE